MLFNGKVTLLTGGSSGIGLEAARQFSAEGARVIITDRNREKLDEAPKLYPASITIRSDALQEEDAKSLLRQVEEKVGIDILCHNAGVLTTLLTRSLYW